MLASLSGWFASRALPISLIVIVGLAGLSGYLVYQWRAAIIERTELRLALSEAQSLAEKQERAINAAELRAEERRVALEQLQSLELELARLPASSACATSEPIRRAIASVRARRGASHGGSQSKPAEEPD